ncbi:hypothetical protein BWI15_00040 [Kribbella sp. ALI-6-A]|uniref:hypothetical protein n=1 Tax=Kribbella sp. ALI-6-A TaxID=1933817 RepID=UPI00097C6353|nr:hypothetical protein [Kribbella sp. ALI-6-A]ONI79119.1 hypothetical protein BWI15_00040 [Kribbella sp. ALI-6-A]
MVRLVLRSGGTGPAEALGTTGMLLLLVAAAFVAYVVSLAMYPNVKCNRCRGTGQRHDALFSYATRPCSNCEGRGTRRRIGVVVFFKDKATAATELGQIELGQRGGTERFLLALTDLMLPPHARRLWQEEVDNALSEWPQEEHPQLISSFLRDAPMRIWHGWYVRIFHPAKAVSSGEGASHGDHD